MNTICPHCEDFREVDIIVAVEETLVKGELIIAPEVFSRCTVCSAEFCTPQQLDESLNNAYRIYEEGKK